VTKDPDTHNLFGDVQVGGAGVSGGNIEGNTRGAINIPLISDHLALTTDMFYRNDPRYINNVTSAVNPNVTPATDVNKVETFRGRLELLWQPIDWIKVYLPASRQEQRTDFTNSIQVCPVCQTNLASPIDYTLLTAQNRNGTNAPTAVFLTPRHLRTECCLVLRRSRALT